MRWLALLVLASPMAATAQVRPTPGAGDPRIQSVTYDANQVVALQVATGYQLTIAFAPDERIENVAVGDAAAWQVTPNKRGDHLFVKAMASGVSTNMTVVTDARSYQFELSPLYGAQADMAFTVRFAYPPPPGAASEPAAAMGRYTLSGDKALWPSAMDDDGAKTFIVWAADRPLPAVYSIGPRDVETLIDGAMREGQYVVDSVQPRLVFRYGKQVARAVRMKADR